MLFMGGRQAGSFGLLTAMAAGCDVRAVVAYDDHVLALGREFGLPLFESISNPELRNILERSDLLISVHGREIVSDELLRLPIFGGINVHPCLYAYKGANPVGRLLSEGNPRASVGVHRMTSELDRGEVLVEDFVDVSGERTVQDVYNRLYPHYAVALLKAIRMIEALDQPLASRAR